jgi:hypothetical protein
MNQNLDSLRTEIQEHLDSRGVVVFHGLARTAEGAVYWDTGRYPNYVLFVDAAVKAGARLLTLHSREFTSEMLDEARDQLDGAELSREERREFEDRIRDLKPLVGSTCTLELSFDLSPRAYVFDLRTEWYMEYCDMLEEIEMAFDTDLGEKGEDFGGGYFSRN